MSEFKVNTEMFGKYVQIPTGYSNEMHIYKVVSKFYSNTYCDVPIVYGTEPTYHEPIEKIKNNPYGLETVLNVIHCGIDETKVVRVALKDCKIMEPKPCTQFDRIKAMSIEEMADAMLEVSDIDETVPFCGNCTRCYEIMDAGELIPKEMCKQCLLAWLQSEVKVEDKEKLL